MPISIRWLLNQLHLEERNALTGYSKALQITYYYLELGMPYGRKIFKVMLNVNVGLIIINISLNMFPDEIADA